MESAWPEAVKDKWEELRADALPRVAYTDLKGCINSLNANVNPAARRTERDRISEEIPDYLLQPAGITQCVTNRRIERHLQMNALESAANCTESIAEFMTEATSTGPMLS